MSSVYQIGESAKRVDRRRGVPQQELVEDLLAIVPTFSGWLDGPRRSEGELKGADLTVEGDR
ncbi:hypothetical protein [Micromonospora sp. NPDC005806]|uniref:hypothetical protein n=1 Tax=Micromonospora sp. NPDC005806 TaxID=3364234 RepID=UPI0036A3964E